MANEGQPKFLVLDANAFIADYWLRSPSFFLLKRFLHKATTTLAVPRVVLEEVVNHYREDLTRAQSEFSQKVNQLERLVPTLAAPLKDPLRRSMGGSQKSVETYGSFLEAELGQLGAKVLDYKDIPHSDILKRDLGRKRPFRADGKGYRDALIWECLLRSCLTKDAVTVLVTQNVSDFCEQEMRLHLDLRVDLLRQHCRESNLELFRTLAEFAGQYIVPYFSENKEFAALAQAGKISGLDLRAVCEVHQDELLKALNDNPASMTADPEVHRPQALVVDTDCDIQVRDASEVSDGVLLVVFEFCPNVLFTCYGPRDEVIAISGERTEESAEADLVEKVEETRLTRICCRMTFNRTLAKAESFEVESVGAEPRVDRQDASSGLGPTYDAQR